MTETKREAQEKKKSEIRKKNTSITKQSHREPNRTKQNHRKTNKIRHNQTIKQNHIEPNRITEPNKIKQNQTDCRSTLSR